MKQRLKGQLHNVIFYTVFFIVTVFSLLYVFVIPHDVEAVREADPSTLVFATRAPSTRTAPVFVPTPEPDDGSPAAATRPPAMSSQPPAATEVPAATGLPYEDPGDTDEGPALPPRDKLFSAGDPVITEDSYADDHLDVRILRYREYDTDIYVADVYVTSAEYLRAGFARDRYGRNLHEVTSSIAKRQGAVLAVNGDYYGARDRGYVVRNGVTYRNHASDRDALAIFADGSFHIFKERNVSLDSLELAGLWQTFTFGPGLVIDGELAVDEQSEVEVHLESNPRTAIAEIEPLHYLLVVSDGRTDEREGLTLLQLGEFLKALGARNAYNLDGGGSSTMVFMGRVVNLPTTYGDKITERSVSDIVYVR